MRSMQYPTDAHEEQTWGWKTKAAINRGINMKTGTRYACRSRSPLGFYHQVSLFYNLTPSLNGFLLTNITESRWYGQQWKVPKHSLHWEFLLCQMCKIERKLCVWPLIFKCKGHPPSHCLMLLFGIFQASVACWQCILLPLFCLSTPILVRTSRQSPPDNSHRRPRVLFVNNPHNVKPQIEFQNETRFKYLYL